MNKKHANLLSARSVCLASAAVLLVSLAGVANAQSTQYDVNGTSAQLGPTAVTTAPYPVGDSQLYVASPYITTLSPTVSVPVTFTATTGIRFESFTNTSDPSTMTTPLDFAPETQLLNTFDADAANPNPNVSGTPTGPLRIDFGSGVSAFGLSVQDAFPDDELFTFTTYDGATLLNTTPFTTGLYDNTLDTPSGKSLFLGAQATGGAVITSVLISSTSLAPNSNGELVDSGYSNDFYFGPLTTIPAAVPEASTTVSFGLLLMLGLGGALLRRKMAWPKSIGI